MVMPQEEMIVTLVAPLPSSPSPRSVLLSKENNVTMAIKPIRNSS